MARVSVEWEGEGFRFAGRSGEHETAIDGDGGTGPSPVSLLLEATAACMAIDVVDILTKGRQEPRSLVATVHAARMDDPPRYVRAMRLEFEIGGDVDRVKAERAVALSFEKYCSVFHSLRDDIEVESEIRLV
ncbi:MAG: OsmC family protein [Gemmatimonadota bacterium]|nr:OsmC family protein [Gemmatimonadota bacterium]